MAVYPLIFGLGGWEILLIVLVILLFVGGSKIPELMKGLGKGVKSFKDGVNGIEETVNNPEILNGKDNKMEK